MRKCVPIVMLHKSARSCKKLTFSHNSPPTMSLLRGFQVLQSALSESKIVFVWKQIDSRAASNRLDEVVFIVRPERNLKKFKEN